MKVHYLRGIIRYLNELEVRFMAVSEENKPCSTYLNRDIVKIVDKLAKVNIRTRSTQIAYMVNEYLKSNGYLKTE